jgi:hypothetical protein
METFLVPMDLDEHGMIGRECRQNCFQYFKVGSKELGQVQYEKLWCPYCGYCGDRNQFMTPGQIEYLKSYAMKKLIAGPLGRTLKQFERRPNPNALFSIGIRVVLPNIQIRKNVEKAIERRIICDKCNGGYAVYGASGWCPFCGPRKPLTQFQENIATVRQFLDIESALAIGPIAFEQLRQLALPNRLVEKALDMAVTAFESFCKAKFLEPIARKRLITAEQLQKKLGAVFQNLERGSDLIRDEFGPAYDNFLSPKELKYLFTAFQKRHVLIHNAGVIDEKYCSLMGEANSKVGQRIVISKSDVSSASSILEILVQQLDGIPI